MFPAAKHDLSKKGNLNNRTRIPNDEVALYSTQHTQKLKSVARKASLSTVLA